MTQNEITAIDTLQAPVDSTLLQPEPVYGILLTPPPAEATTKIRHDGSLGVSFILTGLFILALIIALRFRDNAKHIVGMLHNLTTTRIRQNAFDDTVRETSLMVMLNILWCACAGILCYSIFSRSSMHFLSAIPPASGMLYGMAFAAVYTIFLFIAYWSIGWIFSDRSHAELWVKGFAASQALMAPAFLIIALLALCSSFQIPPIAIAAVAVFLLGKLAFILKGYRIFFNQISSWVLFLCYLCSLEIIPLILCYRGAFLLNEVL